MKHQIIHILKSHNVDFTISTTGSIIAVSVVYDKLMHQFAYQYIEIKTLTDCFAWLGY